MQTIADGNLTDSQAQPAEATTESASTSTHHPMKKFKFLSEKINRPAIIRTHSLENAIDSFKMELGRYIAECRMKDDDEPSLVFWAAREKVYPTLAAVAEDLVSAPASEAYCERIFSVCGDLCSGKRNRMSVNLERRVFLKMNALLIKSLTV